MQNPVLVIIRKVTRRDFFSLFNAIFKYLSPWLVKYFLALLLKDKVFDHYECNDPVLKINVLSQEFSSPIGLAAGFDDHADIVDELCHIGLAFGELGTFTLKGGDTFETTRFYRKHGALFYRNNGYNHLTCKEISPKLALRRGRKNIVGVSLGEDQGGSKDVLDDIVKCVPIVAPYADYIVLNLGTPEYMGVKFLQNELRLQSLFTRIKEIIKAAVPLKPCPLLVKVPFDIPIDAKRVLVERCFSAGVNGLIVAGPSIKVPEGIYLRESDYGGFFTGKPVSEDVNKLVKEYYYLTDGKLPIIASGGVFTAQDAYDRIRAGASLVQIYSVLLYKGPEIIPLIIKELAELVKADGFSNIKEAIGADLRK